MWDKGLCGYLFGYLSCFTSPFFTRARSTRREMKNFFFFFWPYREGGKNKKQVGGRTLSAGRPAGRAGLLAARVLTILEG